MIIHDCKQNGPEWEKLRLGIPTSSCFHKIVTPKGKLSKQADGFMNRLLAEWYMGCPLDDPESTYQSQWMERGHALEDQAVKSYQFEMGVRPEAVGFITTNNGLIGASPDRLIGADGVLELKCPSPATHMGYMLQRDVDDDYSVQLQGELFVSEREFADIQSYCPGFPTVIIRVTRDEEFMKVLSSALGAFVERMLEARSDIEKRYGLRQVEVMA